MGAKATIAVSVALMAIIGALTLTHSPARILRASATAQAVVGYTTSNPAACQKNEVLPGGVSAIRVWLDSGLGPSLRVRVDAGRRVIAEGVRAAGWAGGSVTVPVKPVSHTVSHVKLCLDPGPNSEPVWIFGVRTPAREAAFSPEGQRLGGRFGVEYLAAGGGSWWSRALSVARHVGIGHALSGTWVALLIAAVMVAVSGLALRVAWRELP
jgi:hypothetical protein